MEPKAEAKRGLLEELTEDYGYEIWEESEKTIYLVREQYLDNGYGHYYAEIYLDYNKEQKEIAEIEIDGMGLEEMEQQLEKVIAECPYMEKYNECVKESVDEADDLDELEPPCNDCEYLTMIQSLYEMINSGNW